MGGGPAEADETPAETFLPPGIIELINPQGGRHSGTATPEPASIGCTGTHPPGRRLPAHRQCLRAAASRPAPSLTTPTVAPTPRFTGRP